MTKIVTYISNRKEEFTGTVIGDRGKGCLNLEIKRPGGRTQRILNVPKKDKLHPKFCWFEKSKPKTIPEPTPEPKPTQELEPQTESSQEPTNS